MTKMGNADAGEPGATAGALLRAAREAAGLSVEAVAQQLKLSARQVRALEGDDFGSLPGRTFVRGFARNYARLVALEAEGVLDALPSAVTPALEPPVLHATAPTMGELPTADSPKARWTRWAIPASLAAVVAVAAVYEWARPAAASRTHPAAKEANATTTNSAPSTPPSAEKSETPLPNPVTPPSPEPPQPEGPANAS